MFGGNPDLESEEAGTLTLGFVSGPKSIDGLDRSVDFCQVEIEEYTTGFAGGVEEILAQCHLQNSTYNPNTVFCQAINRCALGERVATSKQANVAFLNVSRVDTSFDYAFELHAAPRRFSIDYVASYLDT